MTNDKKTLAKLAANADTVGLDPVLKRQLETELHAGYAFNAKTAKWFRPFVWVPAILTVGAALAALGTVIAAPVVFAIEGTNGPWALPLLATIPLLILTAFFRLVWLAMDKSQSTAEAMADQYKADAVEQMTA